MHKGISKGAIIRIQKIMKNLLSLFGGVAILTLIIWGALRIHSEKMDELRKISSDKIDELVMENNHLVKLSDSLLGSYVRLEDDMDLLEQKADSLREVAEILELPCEHELELKQRETDYVRMALKKCKEAKAIQTTRVGLAEIKVENQVEICSEKVVIHISKMKEEKRKSFFKGMGAGGLIIGILIILAL